MKRYTHILANDWRMFWRNVIALFSFSLLWKKKEWLIFAALSLFVLLAFLADSPVRYGASSIHSSVLDVLFDFGRWYGKGTATAAIFLGCYLFGLVFGSANVRRVGISVAYSYVVSGLLTTGLKSLFGRWRPYTNFGTTKFTPFVAGPNDFLSLPSGHVTVVFALSSTMAAMNKNIVWKILWYTIAVITACSRIYHDEHWLSDVLLAAIIGNILGVWASNHYDLGQKEEGINV
jgi:membrane-associated phospholipid phosphatase